MPLKRGASDKTRAENIAEMIRAGRPRNQAVAAAYRMQRESEPVMAEHAEHKGSMRYEIVKDAMSMMAKGKARKGAKGGKKDMKGGKCKDMKGGKPGKFGK